MKGGTEAEIDEEKLKKINQITVSGSVFREHLLITRLYGGKRKHIWIMDLTEKTPGRSYFLQTVQGSFAFSQYHCLWSQYERRLHVQ